MEVAVYDNVEDALILVRGVKDILGGLESSDAECFTSEACGVLARTLEKAVAKLSEALEAMDAE